MAIKNALDLKRGKEKIDLTGPMGNAFVLIGKAQDYAKRLGKDAEEITSRMKSGDYENLVSVFDEEFGDYVDLYR